jgi:signal peptidase II
MPKSFGSKKVGGYFLIALFIVLSDQISKFFVADYLSLGEVIYVLPFLNIVMVKNSGVTFGLLSGALQPLVFAIISLVIIAMLCYWAKDNESYQLPACFIVGGAVGNMIDRVIYKAVIDFLDFHLLTYHWPAFNIADSAIVIGVSALFFVLHKEEEA